MCILSDETINDASDSNKQKTSWTKTKTKTYHFSKNEKIKKDLLCL